MSLRLSFPSHLCLFMTSYFTSLPVGDLYLSTFSLLCLYTCNRTEVCDCLKLKKKYLSVQGL